MLELLRELTAAIERREPVALATIIEAEPGSPARPGLKLLVFRDGRKVGNAGGGVMEAQIREDAVKAIMEGRSRTCHYRLKEEDLGPLAAVCGGEATAFIEPYLPRPMLLIVGGGHIGRPLAELAHVLHYEVQVVDVNPDRATVATLDPSMVTHRTSIVVVTATHETDEQALRAVIDTPAAYIGMIGSRRKVEAILGHLRADGVREERLAAVRAPVGLDLGGREPAEIALAILAEIEMVRHGGSGSPRSAQ